MKVGREERGRDGGTEGGRGRAEEGRSKGAGMDECGRRKEERGRKGGGREQGRQEVGLR